MKTRLLMALAAMLVLQGTAVAGVLSDANYRLYYQSPGGDVRVFSTDPLPAGSNVAPDNVWRYDYEVVNKSPNPLYQFYAFYNSDNIDRAQFVSGSVPADWTIVKQGPFAPNFNFKVRYRTLVAGAKIAPNGTLICSGTFEWTGTAVPGAQNYDAVNDGGSESGVTEEIIEVTPTRVTAWGRLKVLYRQ